MALVHIAQEAPAPGKILSFPLSPGPGVIPGPLFISPNSFAFGWNPGYYLGDGRDGPRDDGPRETVPGTPRRKEQAMADNKTTLTLNGRKYQRKSPRTYTHVVVGACDLARNLAHAKGTAWEKQERENYQYMSRIAAGTDKFFAEFKITGAEKAEYMAKDKAILAGRTEAQYIADERARMLACIDEDVKAGRYLLCVLGWSQSQQNALKMADQKAKYSIGVRIYQVGDVVTQPEPNATK